MNLLAQVGFTANQQGIGNNRVDDTFEKWNYMENKSRTKHVLV